LKRIPSKTLPSKTTSDSLSSLSSKASDQSSRADGQLKLPEATITIVKQEAEADAKILGDDKLPDYVRNHIILCCKSFPKNLEYFLLPLRQSSTSKNSSVWVEKQCTSTAVVLLCASDKNEREWKRLQSRFERLYFVRGSVANRKDLIRANVEHMNRAVILTDTGGSNWDFDKSAETERYRYQSCFCLLTIDLVFIYETGSPVILLMPIHF
jgi:hypothetical protein